MRNVANAARLELQFHTRFVTGLTASPPRYKDVDGLGNKEWVVDVFLGVGEGDVTNILKDVLIASTARQLVAKVRQPVMLDRSKQGKYTVVGRADTLPAGAQMPEGSILEPTYHRIEYNLAELSTQFIADITYTHEKWGDKVWGDGRPWKEVKGFDAFGNQVIGSDLAPEDAPELYALTPSVTTTTRHVILTKRGWGSGPDGLRWGTDEWGAPLQKLVENES